VPPTPNSEAASEGHLPPAPPPVPAYPESQQVQALLYRARELCDAGKFREALALADEALTHVPNSPSAAILRNELWAVVARI
jgi:hypothetical protein